MGTPIGTIMGTPMGKPMGKPMRMPMRSFTCFYGHGQGLGRAHGHGQGLGRAHGHGQGHGRAHGFLLRFYDYFYRYVAGQVSLAKSVPPYNYAYYQFWLSFGGTFKFIGTPKAILVQFQN